MTARHAFYVHSRTAGDEAGKPRGTGQPNSEHRSGVGGRFDAYRSVESHNNLANDEKSQAKTGLGAPFWSGRAVRLAQIRPAEQRVGHADARYRPRKSCPRIAMDLSRAEATLGSPATLQTRKLSTVAAAASECWAVAGVRDVEWHSEAPLT